MLFYFIKFLNIFFVHKMDDFIPDFRFECVKGIIGTRNSKIIQHREYSLISVHNRIHVMNISLDDNVAVIGTHDSIITSFNVCKGFSGYTIKNLKEKNFEPSYNKNNLESSINKEQFINNEKKNDRSIEGQSDIIIEDKLDVSNEERLVIGYADGVIEIILCDFKRGEFISCNIMKMHRKRVSGIACFNECFISVCSEGRVLRYDFISESVFSYVNGGVHCENVRVHGERVFVLCGDKTIRMWKCECSEMIAAFAFEEEVCDFVIFGEEMLVVPRNGISEIVNFVRGTRRPFDAFQRVRSLIIGENTLGIHTRRHLYIYKQFINFNSEISIDYDFDNRNKLQNVDNLNNIDKLKSTDDTKVKLINNDNNLFKLTCVRREKVPASFLRGAMFGTDFIFVISENSVEVLGQKQCFTFHNNDIKQIRIAHGKNSVIGSDFIYSASKDKIVLWELERGNKIEDDIENNKKKDNKNRFNTEDNNNIFDKEDSQTYYRNNKNSHSIKNTSKYYTENINDVVKYYDNINFETVGIAGWIESKDEIKSFDIFGKWLVVGTLGGLEVYDRETMEHAQKILSFEKIRCVASYNDCLAIIIEDGVHFLDSNFQETKFISSQEGIVCAGFSPRGDLFCTCTYDNKINVYSFPEIQLVLSLYGHTLPVRNFAVSPDSSLLVSCSADRTVKVWGLAYGECRKSHICDAYTVEFVGDRIFICAGNRLYYYTEKQKLVDWDTFGGKSVALGRGYLIASSGPGLRFYSVQRYEFTPEDVETPIEYTEVEVAEKDKFEKFLRFIEKATGPFEYYTKADQERFYTFLVSLNAVECKNYMCILDSVSVNAILELLFHYVSRNTVVNARIFIDIYKLHTLSVKNSSVFYPLRERLIHDIRDTRDMIGTNEARINIDINYDNIY